MAISFTLTDVIPATPQLIYDAWPSSRGHSTMAGSSLSAAPTNDA